MSSASEIKLQILFAPLPEEERNVEQSGAKEYALRTAEKFRSHTATTSCNVEISHLADWNKESFTTATAVLFMISCGPDGSVHRSVRKTTKWIKEQEKTTTIAMVALLGHAVCKTSAEQMEDVVYASGRRLAKSLQSIVAAPEPPSAASLLEIQIELEAPEEKFDGWVRSLVELLLRE